MNVQQLLDNTLNSEKREKLLRLYLDADTYNFVSHIISLNNEALEALFKNKIWEISSKEWENMQQGLSIEKKRKMLANLHEDQEWKEEIAVLSKERIKVMFDEYMPQIKAQEGY